MISDVLLGNLMSVGAMVTDAASSNQHSVRRMLLLQCFSQGFYCVSSFVLKGYSAVVQNGISLFRNILAIRKIESSVLQWIITILGIVLGLWFNNRGLLGILPVVANAEYTIAVFTVKDNQKALLWAFLINAAMFAVFNFSIMNFVGGVASLVIIVSTARALIWNRKKQGLQSE